MVYELQKILGYTFLKNEDLRKVITDQMAALAACFEKKDECIVDSIDEPVAAIVQVFDREWERTHLFCKYYPGNKKLEVLRPDYLQLKQEGDSRKS